MKFEQVRKMCPKCGGLTITDFSVNAPAFKVVVRNWCPDGHYELVGELESESALEDAPARENRAAHNKKRPRRSASAGRTKA